MKKELETTKIKEKEPTEELNTTEKVKTWKEVFIENYEEKSELAKSLKPFLKSTYKGDVYLPWAVMERLTYMCDDNAKFTTICTQNGGLVHTDMLVNHQSNIQKGEIVSETEAPMYAHFVKVALEFMGKVFIEDYPIQDKDYEAARIYNQNLVNRAIQRAKAKVAARATGLGLKLYEGFDLQFEDYKVEKRPTLTKEEPKVVETPKEEPKVVVEETKAVETPKETPKVETKISRDVAELIDIIKNSDETSMTSVLQRVNISIMKKYGFVLSTKDSEEELVDKISKFPNVEQFKKTIVNLLG